MRRPVLLVAMLVAILIVAGWYAFLIRPQDRRLSSLDAQTTALQAQQSSLQAKLAGLRREQAQQGQRQATLAQLTSAIPPGADVASFIDQVNQLAGSAGIQLRSLSPTEPAATSGAQLSTIKVTITTSGSYGGIVSFLNGLYSLPRLVVVDGVTISTNGSGSSSASPSPSVTVPGGEASSDLQATMTTRIFTTAPPPVPAPTSTAR